MNADNHVFINLLMFLLQYRFFLLVVALAEQFLFRPCLDGGDGIIGQIQLLGAFMVF